MQLARTITLNLATYVILPLAFSLSCIGLAVIHNLNIMTRPEYVITQLAFYLLDMLCLGAFLAKSSTELDPEKSRTRIIVLSLISLVLVLGPLVFERYIIKQIYLHLSPQQMRTLYSATLSIGCVLGLIILWELYQNSKERNNTNRSALETEHVNIVQSILDTEIFFEIYQDFMEMHYTNTEDQIIKDQREVVEKDVNRIVSNHRYNGTNIHTLGTKLLVEYKRINSQKQLLTEKQLNIYKKEFIKYILFLAILDTNSNELKSFTNLKSVSTFFLKARDTISSTTSSTASEDCVILATAPVIPMSIPPSTYTVCLYGLFEYIKTKDPDHLFEKNDILIFLDNITDFECFKQSIKFKDLNNGYIHCNLVTCKTNQTISEDRPVQSTTM